MKSSKGTAGYAIALTVAALLLALLALPTLAVAANPGETPDLPLALPTLPWSGAVSGTLVQYTYPDHWVDYELWYTLHLDRGQSVSVVASIPVGSDTELMIYPRDFNTPVDLISDYVNPSMQRITFMAPLAGDYVINPFGSHPDQFSIDATGVPTVNFSLTGLTVPKSAKKNRAFKVSVNLLPEYDSFLVPMKFTVQRLVSSKWKKYKSFSTKFSGGDTSFTKFSSSPKLPKGKFRVQATFSDVVHPKAKSTGWKKVTVG